MVKIGNQCTVTEAIAKLKLNWGTALFGTLGMLYSVCNYKSCF